MMLVHLENIKLIITIELFGKLHFWHSPFLPRVKLVQICASYLNLMRRCMRYTCSVCELKRGLLIGLLIMPNFTKLFDSNRCEQITLIIVLIIPASENPEDTY